MSNQYFGASFKVTYCINICVGAMGANFPTNSHCTGLHLAQRFPLTITAWIFWFDFMQRFQHASSHRGRSVVKGLNYWHIGFYTRPYARSCSALRRVLRKRGVPELAANVSKSVVLVDIFRFFLTCSTFCRELCGSVLFCV